MMLIPKKLNHPLNDLTLEYTSKVQFEHIQVDSIKIIFIFTFLGSGLWSGLFGLADGLFSAESNQ